MVVSSSDGIDMTCKMCAVFFALLFTAQFLRSVLFLKWIIDIWMKTLRNWCGCQKAHDPKNGCESWCCVFIGSGGKMNGDAKIASKALPQVLHVLLWAFELCALLKIIVFLCYFFAFKKLQSGEGEGETERGRDSFGKFRFIFNFVKHVRE